MLQQKISYRTEDLARSIHAWYSTRENVIMKSIIWHECEFGGNELGTKHLGIGQRIAPTKRRNARSDLAFVSQASRANISFGSQVNTSRKAAPARF